MASSSGERSQFFPAIEKKHGRPIADWLTLLKPLDGRPYAEQMALLQESHGFSRNHANAVVMHFRGSTTSRRFDGPEQYYAGLTTIQADLTRAIFAAITKKYPKLELIVAWNKPMLRTGDHYVFAASAATKHLTLNPWSTDVLAAFTDELGDLTVNKHTFLVPLDWKVNATLLQRMAKARLAEIAAQ